MADIDVGAVDPEKVVRGAENVGLPHVTPPPSEGVIPRDTLPLRPQEDVDAASENAILEGTKRSSRSPRARREAYLLGPDGCALNPSLSPSNRPAAANAFTVLGPSHSITGGLLDSEDEGRIGDVGSDVGDSRASSTLMLRLRLRKRCGRRRLLTSKAPLISRLGRELGWRVGSEAERGKNWDDDAFSLVEGKSAGDESAKREFPGA